MTPYLLEFILAGLAFLGSLLIVFEAQQRRDWLWLGFALAFMIAPLWFSAATFKVISVGDASWLFNRWVSFGVRIPIVIALYVVAWRLHKRNKNRGKYF